MTAEEYVAALAEIEQTRTRIREFVDDWHYSPQFMAPQDATSNGHVNAVTTTAPIIVRLIHLTSSAPANQMSRPMKVR